MSKNKIYSAARGRAFNIALSLLILVAGDARLIGAMKKRSARSVSANASSIDARANSTSETQSELKTISDDATMARARVAFSILPLAFEINRGQTDRRVKFLARGQGYSLFLTQTEAVLALQRGAGVQDESKASAARTLRMKLAGASAAPNVIGEDELPGKSDYYAGGDSKSWVTDVAQFSRVRYESVYPGIDQIFYGAQSQLEYDFVVAPQANASRIRLVFAGADEVKINDADELVLRVGGEEIRQHKPRIYQEANGARREIEGGYKLIGKREVGFVVGAYDESLPLVIDPVLVYSTYLGGSGNDFAYAIKTDAAGNIYLAGEAGSLNFPLANPARQRNPDSFRDAFVTKISAAGDSLVFSTYLGGDDDDSVGVAGSNVTNAVAVDLSGNIYITGRSYSTNFPTANAFESTKGASTRTPSSDAVVTKSSADGSAILYSTYLGDAGDEAGYGIGSIKSATLTLRAKSMRAERTIRFRSSTKFRR